jgi:hypothetical protein
MSSSNKEVDECGTGARWPPITEKQLSSALAFVKKREPFQDGKRLDDWLRIMEDVVEDIGIVYRTTFRLLETNNFKNESFLRLLRALYIMGLAEVDAVKGTRA